MKFRLSMLLVMLAGLLLPCSAMASTEGIGWIPTWEQGVAEARRANKPMLVVSAAPQCHNTPGVW